MPQPFALPGGIPQSAGGPFAVGMGSAPIPGAMVPQQRQGMFSSQPMTPGQGPPGMDITGGLLNPIQAMMQMVLGVGMQPENEVKQFANKALDLGQNTMETMEDTWNMASMMGSPGAFLGNVFKR